MKTTKGALETSLYWQEHVSRGTRNPEQRERCLAAAAELRKQLENLDKPNLETKELK